MERFHMHQCKPEEPNAQGDCTEKIAKYFKQTTKQTISQGSKHGNVYKVKVRSSMMTLTEKKLLRSTRKKCLKIGKNLRLIKTFIWKVQRDSFLFKTARVKLYAGI